MKQRKTFYVILIVSSFTLCYVLMEVGVRVLEKSMTYGLFGVTTGFEKLVHRASQTGVSWQNVAENLDKDMILGWGTQHDKGEAIGWRETTRVRFLLFGDSVAAGAGVGRDSAFPAIADNAIKKDEREVINLAVAGYGIDQMVIKGMQSVPQYEPDVIVIAYIPHNLLRAGSTFMYDLPKPKLRPIRGTYSIQLPQDAGKFYGRYQAFRENGMLSLWFLSFTNDNREYILPTLFNGYYKAVYTALRKLIDQTAKTHDAKVLFLRVTNFTHFRGRKDLTDIAEEVFGQYQRDSNVLGHFSTDECVLSETQKLSLNWETIFVFHPRQIGHDILGHCVADILKNLVSASR